MTTTTTDIEYEADGLRLVAHLASDEERHGARPAVLVAHEGPGLDDHAKSKARRLADLGYVALALDYMGDGKPRVGEAVMARMTELRAEPERICALGVAGLDLLLAQPQVDPDRVAAIGFCFGGTLVLELARAGADLKAVVGFHSGLATARPAAPGAVTAAVLVCIGDEDPFIPPQQRLEFEEEMRAAGADWRMNLYGGVVHSFTNESADGSRMAGVKYHGPTDQRSWRAMLDLFDETLGSP